MLKTRKVGCATEAQLGSDDINIYIYIKILEGGPDMIQILEVGPGMTQILEV